MNERIRELAEQAGITTNLDTDYFERDINKWVDYYSEKFAELIVKECAGVAEVSFPANSHPDDRLMVKNGVLKHFGVEE
jgi:hypothetical protein